MGRAKVVKLYNDRYQGSLMPEDCEKLEQIIKLDEENGVFSDLRHIIYNLSGTDTQKIIDETETYGKIRPETEIDYRVGTLRDEQTLGAAFMYFARNCILGDSVGMGKTAEAAALCQILHNAYTSSGKTFNYLILTEKNLIEQMRFEFVKFTGKYVETLYGDKVNCGKFTSLHPAGVNMNYGVVGSHTILTQNLFIEWLQQCRSMGFGSPFDLLIVDESSVLGNLSAGITKNAKALLPFFDRVVFLNATPFETRLDTFFSQLTLLDPLMLPTKSNFQKEYVCFDYRGMYPKPNGKYKNQKAFRRLVGYRYFARTRRDKGAVMEDCTSKILTSKLSAIQKYWLSRTSMAQMVYDCPNAIDDSIEFNEYNVPKLQSLSKALEDDCEDADTILIFSHYREAQESLSIWLANKGYSNRILCGDTKDTERESIIRGFKNSEFRVLITNVQKGLNFGDCNYCIFYSFDPNPSKMIQFEGRVTRSFNIVGKHIMLLCSEGKELDRLNSVIKTRAQAASDFTNVDLSCIMDLLLEG